MVTLSLGTRSRPYLSTAFCALALSFMGTPTFSTRCRSARLLVRTLTGMSNTSTCINFAARSCTSISASWCSPCAQSFTFLNDLEGQFRGQRLQVLGINLDERREDAKNFLAKHPVNFTVAYDAGGRCPQDFGVQGMRRLTWSSREGVIRHVHLGFRRGEAENSVGWWKISWRKPWRAQAQKNINADLPH